ncbi:hypothetical protein OHA27_35795 [Streptomyces sp. NBC_01619]|uniref:Uncharacterized protein n=1 Tax=Streptomyces pratisoli TaxID=3139917 RepID=A0ACC6QUT9_9ACTN|nr:MULTISPECIES: hypothetical protein [unclassified Streptomyces]MCX4515583.1 hypothetical protein [Streptomyces sp. NBC_01619]
MPHLTCSIDDGIAMLVLSNPPQNRIDAQTAPNSSRPSRWSAAAAPGPYS